MDSIRNLDLERKINSKKIGGRYGLICVALGVIISHSIVTCIVAHDAGLVKSFFWFTEIDFTLNIFIGILIMFGAGYLFGRQAGNLIIMKGKNSKVIGIITGIAVLFSTSFLTSWVGFFQEGINNIGTNDNPFVDYIFKPVFWVTIFGVLPSIIVGLWFGIRVRKEGEKMNTAYNIR